MYQNHKTLFLEKIQDPQEIQDLSMMDLEMLADEIRKEIIYVVSQNGGHLAPSLGVVELTLALLKIFNPKQDKIIWDVGHQSYAYKLLTQGREKFSTLRKFEGISGFPRLNESPYDHFGVGHSGTSISAALGMSVARDLSGLSHKVLAIIGDGSMTAGLAYEGLNQAGDLDRDLIVILNDNEMSISKNVGALSTFLSRKLSDRRFIRFKDDLKNWLRQVPKIGDELINYARRSEESLKSFFTPGMLFEAFKFNYLGPINGHNIRQLTQIFEQVQLMKKPVLIHTLTTKGKGYSPAENNPIHYHGIGCFEPKTGKVVKKQSSPSFSKVFGKTLCQLAKQNQNIIAITAAMPEGTGLAEFNNLFPERFFDVGICEQHAVTFAAGLATQGYRPVVSIYSTFLQRSYDQLVHDVCLQNLPITFCLDRSGLVGEDGPTHHGSFDLSYLRHIPNIIVMAPKDEPELQSMLATALKLQGPVAIRYPRGAGAGNTLQQDPPKLSIGEGEILKKGSDGLIIAVGPLIYTALEAISELEQELNCNLSLLNARFIKPLPKKELINLVQEHQKIVLLEENALAGGFGSAVLEFLCDEDLLSNRTIKRVGLPDHFVEHGPIQKLKEVVGLDVKGLKKTISEILY